MQAQLKSLGKELLAVMLIQDPVQRAKAAADLYKQFAQVAKNYAGGGSADPAQSAAPGAVSSSGEPANASGTTGSTGSGAAPTTADGSAAASSADGTAGAAAVSAATTPAPATAPAVASPVGQTTSEASASGAGPTSAATGSAAVTNTSTTTSTAAGGPATATVGAALATAVRTAAPASTGITASNWHPDPIMEEIKTFASAAQQVYEEAVAEVRAKHGDQSQLRGTVAEMADAQNTLTQAAQEVEGSAATATGYSPTGALSPLAPASTTSLVNLTA